MGLAEDLGDLPSRAIAPTDPDDLRWMAADRAAFVKVSVLRYEDVAALDSELPDVFVVRGFEPDEDHMRRIGIEIADGSDEAARQVLVV